MLASAWAELRSLPIGVWSATLLFLGTTLAATFYQPMLEAADETFHVDMVRTVAAGEGYPDAGGRDVSPGVWAARGLWRVRQSIIDPPPDGLPNATANCGRVEERVVCDITPAFSDLEAQFSQPGPMNRMTTHPPAYYLLVAGAVHVPSTLIATDVDADTQLWLYRVVGLVMTAALPLVAGLGARELGFGRSAQVLAATTPMLLTGLVTRTAVTVNNDNLLLPLLASWLLILIRIEQRGVTRRRLRALGVLLGLAMLTKAFAVIMAVLVPFLLLLASRPAGTWAQRLRRVACQTTTVAGWSLLLGGWWYVRNLFRYGTPHVVTGARESSGEVVQTSFGDWAVPFSAGIMRRMFERTGQIVNNQPVLLLPIAIVVIILIVLGVRHLGWRTSLVAMVPLVAMILVIGTRLWLAHLRHGQVVTWHARYYFPVIAGLIWLLVAGIQHVHGKMADRATAGWTLAVLALSTWMMWIETRHESLRRWTTDATYATALERMELWSPVPFEIFWAAIALASLGLIATAVAALGAVARPGPSPKTRDNRPAA